MRVRTLAAPLACALLACSSPHVVVLDAGDEGDAVGPDVSAADGAVDGLADGAVDGLAGDGVSMDVSAADVPADVVLDTRPADYGRLGTLTPAAAQTLRANPTANYRGVDLAYDPGARAFLVVYGNAPIGGAFLDDDGLQVGDGFRVTEQAYDGSNWSQAPRVAFGGGGFLAAWNATVGSAVVLQTRRVRFGAGGVPAFDGPEVTLSDPGTNSNQESYPAVAFSPASNEFLVAWAQNGLKARRVGADGAPLGGVVGLSPEGVWVEQPSALFHPGCGCFFVAYASVEGSGGNVSLARVQDGTGALLGTPLDVTGEVSLTKVTDVAYLADGAGAGTVLTSWFQAQQGGVSGFFAQRFGADGAAQGAAQQVFAGQGSYDGYDLAWSAATGTSLGVFHGTTAEAWGAELDDALVNDAPRSLTTSGAASGFFLPRAVAHPERPFWLVAGSADYARVVVQRFDRGSS